MRILISVLTLVVVAGALCVPASAFMPPAERYPYEGPRFSTFVTDSYQYTRAKKTQGFYEWFASAYRFSRAHYPSSPELPLGRTTRAISRDLARLPSARRAEAEIRVSAWLHKMVKATIPRFSLDGGFEFANTVRYGERQCFLQSVLIAGLLQRMAIDAGVVMVFKNVRGEESNNGHAVALVKLADGRDIIVDASDPQPFAKQQGLFVESGGYRYVYPIFVMDSSQISGYRTVGDGRRLSTKRVRTLDHAFLRSQFYYYRGERTPGGLILGPQTPKGLATAARALRTSVMMRPANPLAVYMLGRVYLAQGNVSRAQIVLELSRGLYNRYGWVPAGPLDFLAAANRRSPPGPHS